MARPPKHLCPHHWSASRPCRGRHATIAPYGPFTCADGSVVLLAVQNDRQWKTLCEVLGLPELPADPRFARNPDRVAHVEQLEELITARPGGISASTLIERLDTAGLPWGRLNDMRDSWPPGNAGNRWTHHTAPSPGCAPPVDITGVGIAMGDVPALGQHTDGSWPGSTKAE